MSRRSTVADLLSGGDVPRGHGYGTDLAVAGGSPLGATRGVGDEPSGRSGD